MTTETLSEPLDQAFPEPVGGPSERELAEQVWAALSTVMDPELDEPVTDLGFVRGHWVDGTQPGGAQVEVHLRLPTSFCSPNFAYLMASDAYDAVSALPAVGRVTVVLHDHHDSDLINAGLAANAGYRGTFGHEAEDSLDELRLTFQRKAHTAAMERACSQTLTRGRLEVGDLHRLTLGELEWGTEREALLRRRRDLGFSVADEALVMVDEHGEPIPASEVPIKLRFARTVRISIDGNAHFCRALLGTRYPDAVADQKPRAYGSEPADPRSSAGTNDREGER